MNSWDEVNRQTHDEHRLVCDINGCEWCDGWRAEGFCRACGTNTEVMDDGNCSCGGQILLGIDWGTR